MSGQELALKELHAAWPLYKSKEKCKLDGMDVGSQADCEQKAIENGDAYYQYLQRRKNKKCATFTSCSEFKATGYDWKIFRRPALTPADTSEKKMMKKKKKKEEEKEEDTSGVTLPVGHMVALHNVGGDAFLRKGCNTYPFAGERGRDEGNIDMTGWKETSKEGGGGGAPYYYSRFYVAQAPNGKVALWNMYTGFWMYIKEPSTNPHTGSISKRWTLYSVKGDVQQVLANPPADLGQHRRRSLFSASHRDPNLSEFSFQVIPAGDGKVKLKTKLGTYLMADAPGMDYVGHRAEDSYSYKKYPEYALWKVVDLGKFDAAIPQSFWEPCHEYYPPSVWNRMSEEYKKTGIKYFCLKAGPEHPEFEILR